MAYQSSSLSSRAYSRGEFWKTVASLVVEILGLRNDTPGLNLMSLTQPIPCTFAEEVTLDIFTSTRIGLGTRLFTAFSYISAAAFLLALRG